jgi:2-hydroxy-3-keto-5-methylthiopentenyl-1-phosphate phosphatase
LRIFCDFDGTISREDTTDLVLTRLADPSWESVEADWAAGRIDAAACMTQQIALLKVSLPAIDAVLDTIQLRDGFGAFLAWARNRAASFTVVSDGVDYFINRILARNGIVGLRVIANRLIPNPAGGWLLEQPFKMPACASGSGVCKCSVLAAFNDDRPLVFIGDGRSDFCVSAKPDILFATGNLPAFCRERDLPHTEFTSFDQVQAALVQLGSRASSFA